MPNGTFATVTALIGVVATTLAAQGIGTPALDGAIATVLTAFVAHFAQNSAPPSAPSKS
jgi:hypothetical protein